MPERWVTQVSVDKRSPAVAPRVSAGGCECAGDLGGPRWLERV